MKKKTIKNDSFPVEFLTKFENFIATSNIYY